MHIEPTMDVVPSDMFFPLGAVFQFQNGGVEPVLDPDCRHDVQCVLECISGKGWVVFLSKLKTVLVPKPNTYVLTVHSLTMCDIEMARGKVSPKGVQTWVNYFTF